MLGVDALALLGWARRIGSDRSSDPEPWMVEIDAKVSPGVGVGVLEPVDMPSNMLNLCSPEADAVDVVRVGPACAKAGCSDSEPRVV